MRGSIPWSGFRPRAWRTGWGTALDYIIFGLGAGATLTLVGWAFREWGPSVRDRSPAGAETVLSGYELVDRMAWQRFCRSCGALLAIVGLLVLLATIIATALMLSNRTGSTIVLSTMAACVVATLVWLGLFLHRFGARGIIRPKPTPLTESISSRTPSAAAPRGSFIGPPIPDREAGVSAGDSPRVIASVPGDDAVNDEADSEADDQLAVAGAIDEPAEDSPADDSLNAALASDDPPGSGPVREDADVPGEAAAGDQAEANRDMVSAAGPPSEGRLIVKPAANDDEVATSFVPDDTDQSRASSGGDRLDDSQTEDADVDALGEGAPAASGPGSSAEPEADDGRAPSPEAAPRSGRADAVRRLRERRVRRLRRDSPAPE